MRRVFVLMLIIALVAAAPTFHTDFMLPEKSQDDDTLANDVLIFIHSLGDMALSVNLTDINITAPET